MRKKRDHLRRRSLQASPKTESARIIDTIFELLKQSLEAGEDSSHHRVWEIFCQRIAGTQGQESSDWGGHEGVTREGGDFQVLWGLAGGDEWEGRLKGAKMAAKKLWIKVLPKASKPKVPESLEAVVKTKSDEFVESFLKPGFIKEPPKDY